jgi:pyruvate dehydrogenase E1 component
VTSYTELRREALSVERWNRLHPVEAPKTPYILEALKDAPGPIVAATDFMKTLPDQLAPWLPGRLVTLGTDGFGRSDTRAYLRRFFENDGESIAAAAISRLARDGKFDPKKATDAIRELGINPEAPEAARA